MSWVPAEQVIQAINQQRQAIAAEQARIANFVSYHAAERQKLDVQYTQAAHDLGNALLPSLDARAIANAAQAVGLVGLPGENIPARLEARRAWLVERIRDLERDPRFAQRELLRHPNTGSLTRALAENEQYRQPSVSVVSTCELHMRFSRLLVSGFDTPEFSAPWWRYSYWEDRSAAAEIVKMFPGKTAFAEVREEYRVARENLQVYDAEVARVRAEIAGGEALSREHAEHVDEHQHLDERGLEHTRGRIIQHLLTSDASLVSQRLQPWPAIRMLFLRASGIAAKVSYLDGIQRTNLAEMQKELTAQEQKLRDTEQKTRRKWAPMPLDRFRKLSEDRRPRYEKRWQRFGKTYVCVQSYDRWDRGRYYNDLLWWDLMTRGRYDGSYLPEVATFHRYHPGYLYNPDHNALKQAYADGDDVDNGGIDFGGSDTGGSDVSDNDNDDANDAQAAAESIAADASNDGPDMTGTDVS